MNARWRRGFSAAATTLQAAPWLALKVKKVGVRVFDVMHDILLEQESATAMPPTQEMPPDAPMERKTNSRERWPTRRLIRL